MKKLILIIAAFMPLASCDVLDVKPQSAVPAESVFKDKAGLEKAMVGAYTSFQSLSYYGRSYLIFSDLAADNLRHAAEGTSQDYAQVDNNALLPENGAVSSMWAAAFEGINIANNVIANAPNVPDITAGELNSALAEMYFVRALNNFNLLAYFGGIPLRTTPTEGTAAANLARTSAPGVFDSIIQDLTFAEQHLGAGGPKTRASQFAATALLARVYLYKGDYTNAKAKATSVINNGGYSIINDYAEVFTDASAESIFEIDFTQQNRNRIAEYNFPKSLAGRREVAPDATIVAAYETGDERLAASIAVNGGEAYAIKYDDLSIGADNVIVLRLAEMYLIRAEAEAKLEGSVPAIQSDINVIRDRADLDVTPFQTYGDLLRAIERERRVEFAFEGQRWFDLVRTGRAVDVLLKVTSVNQTLFPIPLDEILTNKDPGMTQNPGY